MIARSPLAICLLSALAIPIAAQRPDSLRGELRQTFREVRAVQELADGRTLILDSEDRFVYVADFRTGEAKVIGEQGMNDREYLWPSRLLRISEDTTFVWDAVAGRIHVLTNEGGVFEIRRSVNQVPGAMARFTSFNPITSDDRGRLYTTWSSGDSTVLVRWDRHAARVDTVMRFRPTSTRGLVFSYDRWAVSGSGVATHVHMNPYRVDMHALNTPVVRGSPISLEPRLITPEIRRGWLALLHRPKPTWTSLGGGKYGFVDSEEGPVDYGSWPLVLPAVAGEDAFVQFASDGSLVIERLAIPGLPSEYDVIDARGQLVDRFELPAGTQIAATGSGVVYVTVRGSDGRLKLQRFTVRSPR